MIQKLDSFFKKWNKLSLVFFWFFYYGSKLTRFMFFNLAGFVSLNLALFFVPLSYSVEFINFLIQLLDQLSNFFSYFKALPPLLKCLLLFYFLLLEIVWYCTVLSYVPFIKEKMIEKYKDPLILKKLGYNLNTSTLRRATMSGFSLAATAFVAGDAVKHMQTLEAISTANADVWKAYSVTKDKNLLTHLQKVPTQSVTSKMHEISGSLREYVLSWKSGSTTRD